MMRIIRSGDRYAIAKGRWIFTRLLDLKSPRFWWPVRHHFAKDCWGTLDEVECIVNRTPTRYSTVRNL